MPVLPDPPPTFTVTSDIKPKTRAVIITEGFLYFIIGAATPITLILESNVVLDGRGWAMLILASLIGGANALKAFFSQSMSSK